MRSFSAFCVLLGLCVILCLQQVRADDGTMLLPIWNHPTDTASGTTNPAPQATACAHPGHIALTYNEGPSDVTAKVLNGLKAGQAKASFFVNATWLYTQQYAMILQRAYNDGHLIGMTYRAPGDTTDGMTDEQIRSDVTNSAKVIETLIGVAPKYIRLHYTQPEDTRLENIVRDMGYTLVYYNLDTQDYNFKSNPKGIAELYQTTFDKQLDTYDSKGSFISVQYDIPDTGSWQAIYDTINQVDTAGYKLVRLDGCLNDKQPYKESASSKKAISDKHSFGTSGYKEGQVHAEKPASMMNDDNATSDSGEDGSTTKNENTGSITVSSWISLFIFVLAINVLA
ncbi:hypothetical protein BDB00DRAFT_936389 [Zychaea mexicana]|uniref:uncharacterized protein n=1 Tax=Zychaea mexicana TaxID=64656 RepID=UPI0022FDFE59|nr:uncharacterized protein BDB00DRAFT_936389 [Zychaea mexicana]KAI9497182.1 hypothetical protein BDB00DRAFT_936389 [Zychaea mexicana]